MFATLIQKVILVWCVFLIYRYCSLFSVVIIPALQQMNVKATECWNIAKNSFRNSEFSKLPCRYFRFLSECSSDLSRITRLHLDQHLTRHHVPRSRLHFHQEHHLLAQHLPHQEVSSSHR